MQITYEHILHLEKLSRLQLDEQTRQNLLPALNNVLGMIEQLQNVNTDGVEPLVHLTDEHDNTLRNDQVAPMLTNQQALANAPLSIDGYFATPKYIHK